MQRKLKEACLATKLDRAWTKHRVLTTYLNQVYYGNQAYGIEAASQTYFSKSAKRLTLEDSALLAGLTQAPSINNPFTTPARAVARRTSSSGRCSRPASSAASATWRPPRRRSTSAPAGSTARSASRTSSATCATS